MSLLALKYAFADFKKNKLRSFLGTLGVTISIFMLTSVSVLTDTASTAFVNYMVTDAGNIDMELRSRQVPGQENWSEFFDPKPLAADLEANITQIDLILPRIELWGNFSRVNSRTGDVETRFAAVHGLNSTYEQQVGFGFFRNEPGYEPFNFSAGIPVNQCVVSPRIAEYLNLDPGDELPFTIRDVTHNFTVAAVAVPVLKIEGIGETNWYVIADLGTLYSWLGDQYDGKVNSLALTFENSQSYYDIRDVEGSQEKVISLAEQVQLHVGWGYSIRTPKVTILGYSEFMTMAFSIIFVFIMLISMMISGILINGILSTAVEERIREFGVFRTLGAHRSYNIWIILYQGIIVSLFGSTAGIFSSIFAIDKLALPFINNNIPEGFLTGGLQLNVTATSIILSYAIGIGVSMLVSISPALKVARMKIVESINPYRHEEVLYKIEKESTVNVKLILFGLVMAVNGGVIYFLIPRLLASMDWAAFGVLMITVLLVFLVGMTLMGLGLMPLIQRFFVRVFTPFFRKVINVVKITIHRYQRRNSSTVIMFSISFSFIIFATSVVRIQQLQVTALQKFNTGSHLVVHSDETVWNAPTEEIKEQLLAIDGVERVSVVLADTSLLSDTYQGGAKEFQVELGDYINYQSASVKVAPVDENYPDSVFGEYIEFDGGDRDVAFAKLFNGSNTCIISTSIADAFSIGLGERIRLTFHRGDEQEIVGFYVVGIASKLPGFRHFRSQSMGPTPSGGGVMISGDLYQKYMEIPRPAYVDKVFVRLTESAVRNYSKLVKVQNTIQDTIGEKYGVYVVNVERRVQNQQEMFRLISLLFEAILAFTVIICMFGLFSSAYSTILERKREIGIVRTLGLRARGVGQMFTLESLIILLSSATAGSIVGFLSAYLMTENMILFTESPRIVGAPWDTLGRIYGLTVVALVLGMQFLLRKVKKQNLISIFRETL